LVSYILIIIAIFKICITPYNHILIKSQIKNLVNIFPCLYFQCR